MTPEKKIGRRAANSYGRPWTKRQKRLASKAVRKLSKFLDDHVTFVTVK